MKRIARPAPAYKARLAQRRERLEQRRQLRAANEALRLRLEHLYWHARKASLDANAPPLPRITPGRITCFFEQLMAAATDTTRRLAQDFTPKKGIGDARFFA